MAEERNGTLVILACHAVFDPVTNQIYAEHSEDRPIYESHISYAFNHLTWRASAAPLLVISGGLTKTQRRCSESRSYLELAKFLDLSIPDNIELEEYALTSIENLLFSLYVYHLAKKLYPEHIEVISWEFKRSRFEKTLDALNNWSPLGQKWSGLKFFPVGDLWGKSKANALDVEMSYINSLVSGIDSYYKNNETQNIIKRRDVHDSRKDARRFYADYPLPF